MYLDAKSNSGKLVIITHTASDNTAGTITVSDGKEYTRFKDELYIKVGNKWVRIHKTQKQKR